MNHHQKQYALNRVTEIQKIKLTQAREKYQIKGKRLSVEEELNLIFLGKVKLRDRKEVDYYTKLSDAFDFTKHETADGFDKKYDVVYESIITIAQKAKDQIMLGDCNEALKLLKQLEDIKV